MRSRDLRPRAVASDRASAQSDRRVSFGATARDTHAAQDRVRHVAIDHHDDIASVFDDYYDVMHKSRFGNAFAYGRHKVDVLLETLLKDLAPGAEVLDIGCGTGVYLRRFTELGFSSAGVEPAPAMLERARRTAPDSQVHIGVATALPVASASYDLVTAIEVYRYLHGRIRGARTARPCGSCAREGSSSSRWSTGSHSTVSMYSSARGSSSRAQPSIA